MSQLRAFSQDIPPPDAPAADTPPADTPPADTPPADTPPADTPPADTPPADTPPADTPPADTPPADTPPADTPPADTPPADTPPADTPPADTPSADTPPADAPPVPLTTSAQAGDIQKALEDAGLWEKSKEVGPLLNTAKVPDNVKVEIWLKVDSHLNVTISVKTDPKDSSGGRLAALLNPKYAAKMKAAIKKADLSVTDSIELKWMEFK